MTTPEGQSAYVAVFAVDRIGQLRAAIGFELTGQALDALARRLTDLAVAEPAVRLSGDQLALAFSARDDAAAAGRLEDLLDRLQAPLQLGADTLCLSLSAGLAVSAGPALDRAGLALDQARASGRRLTMFDPDEAGVPSANLDLMSGMLWALRSGHVELEYQPRYSLRSRGVDAVEALVRWRHPTRGLLRPDLFIPLAEATGHIRMLTDWVLVRAMADQARLARLGREVAISINLSGRLLSDPDFAAFVEETAPQALGALTFEIREAAVIDRPDRTLEHIARMQAAGVRIAIDHYGAGPSSIACLERIGAAELKLDATLTAGVAHSQRAARLARATIDLAHGLDMTATAKGVETPEAFQLLASLGCDAAQGFLIAAPMPLSELMGFLADDGRLRRAIG